MCQKTDKTFSDLIYHFIVSGDGTSFQMSDIGSALVVASYETRKPEKKCQDSCNFITLYQTGTPGGSTGPTAFLMKGAIHQAGFTDQYLVS